MVSSVGSALLTVVLTSDSAFYKLDALEERIYRRTTVCFGDAAGLQLLTQNLVLPLM